MPLVSLFRSASIRGYGVIALWLWMSFGWMQCQPAKEILSTDPNPTLRFSDRIVVFDTVLAGFRTTTQRLMVYNPGRNVIRIPSIALANQSNQGFRIAVNGRRANEFANIEILGGDSLLVLVEGVFDNNQPQPVTELLDSIVFNFPQRQQAVYLLAWGQRVNVISRQRITQPTVWTKGVPYLLLDSLVIAPGGSLTLQDSVQVYAFNQAYVRVQGSLAANGLPGKWVAWRGFRREAGFENRPGQWQGILAARGSQINLQYTEIRNVLTAIQTLPEGGGADPQVQLRQVILQHLTQSGLQLSRAQLQADNLLIANCIGDAISLGQTGTMTLNNCTLANFEFDFVRRGVSFLANAGSNWSLQWTNVLIWGSRRDREEISLAAGQSLPITQNCLLRSQLTGLQGNNNLVNIDPLFQAPAAYDFSLRLASPALKRGFANGLLIDILGKPRVSPPDIGAYERQPN
jgi:hypothetical protein